MNGHHWKAEVTVTGIPVITEEEFERANSIIQGVMRHDTHADRLALVWRFTNGSPDIWDAQVRASAAWREAVACVESAYDPVCTDFRVRQVEDDERGPAEGVLYGKLPNNRSGPSVADVMFGKL